MPFSSQAQQRFAFGTKQPWAKRWARETDFSRLPKRVRKKMQQQKDAGTMPGAMLSGPGGMLATPGMGGRKWGNRTKRKDCTCNKAYEPGQLCPYCTADLALPDIGWYRCGHCGEVFYADDTDSDYEDYRAIRADRAANRGLPPQPAAIPAARVLRPPRYATKEQLAPGVTRIRGNLCNVHGRYGPCDASQSGKRKPKAGKGRVPKGRKPAKPKLTPEQRAQEHAAQQAENRTKVLGDLGIAPDGQQALEALRSGQQPDAAALERGGFAKAGLVEQAADGSYRLTPSGRAALAAASSGDAGRAGDIISSARDRTSARTARQEEATQRKRDAEAKRATAAAERAKRAEEAKKRGGGGGKGGGSRSSSGNGIAERQQRERERQEDRKRRQEEHAQDRAQRQREHEQDRQQRQREHEEDRAQRLEERRQAVAERRRSKPAPVATRRTPIVMPNRTTRRTKAMNEPMAVWNGTEWMPTTKAETYGGVKRSKLDDSVFAGPDRSFPIKTAQDVRDAVRSLGRTKHDKAAVKRGIIRRARAVGAMDALPESWREKSYEPRTELGRKLWDIRERGLRASFAVFKDDTDAWRWVARTTTAYRDRDGEIITTKALELDAQRMTQTKQFGPLRYWHIGNPDPFDPLAPWGNGLDIGDCDYSIVIGRTSIESGTFKSHAIGKAFAEHAHDYELSPGFFHPPNQPNVAGEYDNIRRFERSVVPIKYGRASNLFTGLTVKEHRMDQQTYKARVEAFMQDMNAKGVPPEIAATALAGMEQADKSATAQGIAYKSDDAPTVYTGPDGEQGVIIDGRFVALKAMAPASMEQAADTEMADAMADQAGESDAENAGESGEESYIGDMSPDEFRAFLIDAMGEAINQYGSGISGKMAEMDDALKNMGYARMKSEQEAKAHADEIATLKAQLAKLEGDQPAVTMPTDIEAAVKSEGPKAPPTHPAVPPYDPSRPFQGWAAQTWPQLYDNTNPPNRS